MSLAINIVALRDRSLADLAEAKDYFTDTKIAWTIVTVAEEAGIDFSSRGQSEMTSFELWKLSKKSPGYTRKQVAESTFQQYVAIFESFYFDLVSTWLMAFPQSLGNKSIDFKTVLEIKDGEPLVRHVVEREVNEIVYKRPAEWFAYLEKLAKLDCPNEHEIGRIAEAKASRDILIHNRGIANKIYRGKAGMYARFEENDRIEISAKYLADIFDLIRKIVVDLTTAAHAKAL